MWLLELICLRRQMMGMQIGLCMYKSKFYFNELYYDFVISCGQLKIQY